MAIRAEVDCHANGPTLDIGHVQNDWRGGIVFSEVFLSSVGPKKDVSVGVFKIGETPVRGVKVFLSNNVGL